MNYLKIFVFHKYITFSREILGVKEGERMNDMSFLKGMGVGLVVGSVAGMIATPKKNKFSIGKALKSMGDVMDNVAHTIGM